MSLTALVPADLDAKIEEYRRIRPLLTILHGALYRLISKSDQFACANHLKTRKDYWQQSAFTV